MKNQLVGTLLGGALATSVACGGAVAEAPVTDAPVTEAPAEVPPDAVAACAPTGGPMDVGDLSITARRVRYAEPVLVEDATGARVEVSELVELEMTTTKAVYVGGLFPALAVGEHIVSASRYEAPCRQVFWEPNPEQLPDGEEVFYQWGDSPRADGVASGFVFRAAELPVVER